MVGFRALDSECVGVHSSAYVGPHVTLGKDVVIEPFAVVKGHAILHDGVVVKSHAYIDGYTEIGQDTIIWPSASIGTQTQDLKFKGEKTGVRIGKRCQIRESATVNASCGEGSTVVVGDDCLIMAYCHIAHHCELGRGVIMANGATLAGHVSVEEYAIIGGLTPIHQFSNIGAYAMVGGMSRVTRDVPPYTIGSGVPYRLGGLNLVGLKRHGFSLETRRMLARAFRLTYRSALRVEEALTRIESELPALPEISHWLTFCRNSKRGLIGMDGSTSSDDA